LSSLLNRPMNELRHEPVLLREAIQYLDPKPGENFIDGTVGHGGHAKEILKNNAPNGKVFAFDRDETSLEIAKKNLSAFGERVLFIHDNFANLDKYVHTISKTRGILLDLGYSLLQIKDPARGFSFSFAGPLDMRYDQRQELTVADIVNKYTEQELAQIIKKYGEERYARQIARKIVEQRKKSPIATTTELVGIIGQAVPKRYLHAKIHFATRTFQALRIETNKELQSLETVLPKALGILEPEARIVVISFHSLEEPKNKN
jgi:16S rRNA (cytosine1402-N4)-methyltransferase